MKYSFEQNKNKYSREEINLIRNHIAENFQGSYFDDGEYAKGEREYEKIMRYSDKKVMKMILDDYDGDITKVDELLTEL